MRKNGCRVVKDVTHGLTERPVPKLGTLSPKNVFLEKGLGRENLEDTTDTPNFGRSHVGVSTLQTGFHSAPCVSLGKNTASKAGLLLLCLGPGMRLKSLTAPSSAPFAGFHTGFSEQRGKLVPHAL